MECQFCHKEFYRPCALAIHERTCKENPNRKPLKNHVCNFPSPACKPDGWECCHCGSIFRTRRDLYNHVHDMHADFIGHTWNKGLTKETNSIIRKYSETLSKNLINRISTPSFLGKPHSDETRCRISESRKRFIEEHPDQVPFKLNHASRKSYPEEYFEELFIKENIPLQYHLQVSRYELDFYNKDLMKYVEIDGEQHFSEYMIKHDKEREEFLSKLGWSGMRIRWANYQKMSDEEKKNVVNSIKEFMVR